MATTARAERYLVAAVDRLSDRRVRIALRLVFCAAAGFAVLRFRSLWHDGSADLRRLGWEPVVASSLLALAGLVCSAAVWLGIVSDLGTRVKRQWIGIYLQAQLAKYLPGTVWQYAGRVALAQQHGVSARTASASLPIELAALALSAVLVAMALFGWPGLVAAAVIALVALVASRREIVRSRRVVHAFVRASARDLGLSPVWGMSLWLLARSLVHADTGEIPLFVGAFGAAWLVGLVAVFAPGGLGVREAVLVALLHGRIGTADAVVLALASRVVLTLVDAFAALCGALVLRADGRRAASAPAEAGAT